MSIIPNSIVTSRRRYSTTAGAMAEDEFEDGQSSAAGCVSKPCQIRLWSNDSANPAPRNAGSVKIGADHSNQVESCSTSPKPPVLTGRKRWTIDFERLQADARERPQCRFW